MDELLTIADVAKELRVSTRTVRRYLKRGILASLQITPQLVRIRRNDLDAFLDKARRVAPEGRSRRTGTDED